MKPTSFLLMIPLIMAACTQPENYGKFQAADEGFHTIVPSDAVVHKIGGEYLFTEGPVWCEDGFLLFSDIPANKIYKWTPGGDTSVFLDPSNNSNGLVYDSDGRLVVCEHSGRVVSRYEKDGTRTLMAEFYHNKRFSSPNDLVIHSSEAIFFTDPPWGLPGLDNDPAKEIPFNGVYLLKDGEVFLIDSTLFRPNGIALSPDEKYLYVGDSEPADTSDIYGTGRKFWLRYELNQYLTPKEKVEYLIAPDSNIEGSPDGMKTDEKGNIYCTGPGGILIYNAEGKYLGLVSLPELPSNCAFGGDNNNTLFITARKHVYSLDLKISGTK